MSQITAKPILSEPGSENPPPSVLVDALPPQNSTAKGSFESKLALVQSQLEATRFDKRRPSLCVFVASLRATRSDDDLCRSVTAHFLPFGALVSVKVLRDPANRPYAFVQYTNDTDCRLAIAQGHNSELDGRKLRCEAAKVNRTLFISLSLALSKEEVLFLVSEYGETELVAPSSPTGRIMKGSDSSYNWFIKFAYRDDAIRAFACFSDKDEYQVEWTQNIDDLGSKPSHFDKLAIFIGQLPSNTRELDIRCHFSNYGEIREVSVIHKPGHTFAFVTFADEAAAASAVGRDNHAMFMNKTIHVQYKEFSSKAKTRTFISPRVPVALAPPPIHLKRFTGGFAPRAMPRDYFEDYPVAYKAPLGDRNRNIPAYKVSGKELKPRTISKLHLQYASPEDAELYYYIPSAPQP